MLGRRFCSGESKTKQNKQKGEQAENYKEGLLRGEVLGILHGEKITNHVDIGEAKRCDTVRKDDTVDSTHNNEETGH